jgi:hypothetical protein
MSYTAENAGAYADVSAAGAMVAFTLAGQGTYDPSTGVTTPAADLAVLGAAVEKKGSLFAYQALSLVAAKARTLFFVPTTYGELPPLDSVVSWGGVSYTVKNVAPIAPDGVAIAATVIVSL